MQSRALASFTTLYQIQPSWAGRLVLSIGLDMAGAALSVATNIAGGVSLAVDDDASRVREVVRSGTADFVVNTLDEALRAIKNELRKAAPLSVALKADPNAVLREILERGLKPQLFSRFCGLAESDLVKRSSEHFAAMGVELVDFESPTRADAQVFPRTSNAIVAPLLARQGWALTTFNVPNPTDLRELDRSLLGLLQPEDDLRRRWLDGISKILQQRQRPLQRCVWLTRDEQERLNPGSYS